jgi:hypothetical protein
MTVCIEADRLAEVDRVAAAYGLARSEIVRRALTLGARQLAAEGIRPVALRAVEPPPAEPAGRAA